VQARHEGFVLALQRARQSVAEALEELAVAFRFLEPSLRVYVDEAIEPGRTDVETA
jgi:hypothetical protein